VYTVSPVLVLVPTQKFPGAPIKGNNWKENPKKFWEIVFSKPGNLKI